MQRLGKTLAAAVPPRAVEGTQPTPARADRPVPSPGVIQDVLRLFAVQYPGQTWPPITDLAAWAKLVTVWQRGLRGMTDDELRAAAEHYPSTEQGRYMPRPAAMFGARRELREERARQRAISRTHGHGTGRPLPPPEQCAAPDTIAQCMETLRQHGLVRHNHTGDHHDAKINPPKDRR